MSSSTESVPAVASTLAANLPLSRGAPGARRSDRSLIRGAISGSEADLEILFRRHWPRAYRAAFLVVHDHAAAEDIAQEAFVAAVRRLEQFDRRRPFAPWLGAITVNRAIDWTRGRNSRREVSESPPEATAAPENPDGSYSHEVLRALAELSPEHRAVVVMRYVLEYTPGEIARAMELPRGTVNSRLRRGLDALEAHLRRADLP